MVTFTNGLTRSNVQHTSLAADLSWSMYISMSVLIYNFLRIMINPIALKWIVTEMYVGRAEQKSHDFFVYLVTKRQKAHMLQVKNK